MCLGPLCGVGGGRPGGGRAQPAKPVIAESTREKGSFKNYNAPPPLAENLQGLDALERLYGTHAAQLSSGHYRVDPYALDHAKMHRDASGQLLAALRRHHLVHDFVPRPPDWYTNQTCAQLLPYYADVLPRSRNVVKTMEYSMGNLKEQMQDLKFRNRVLDAKHLEAMGAPPLDEAPRESLNNRITRALFPNSYQADRARENGGPWLERSHDRGLLTVAPPAAAAPPAVPLLGDSLPGLFTPAQGDSKRSRSRGGGEWSGGVSVRGVRGGAFVDGWRRRGRGLLGSISGFTGKNRPADGVKFDKLKQRWSAMIDVGRSRFNLGTFATEEEARRAYAREEAKAKELGYGANALFMPGGEGGKKKPKAEIEKECEGKLRNLYQQVHAVMLEARELEVVTSTLRATIARMHDRNRVMERTENGLSPLALAWLAEPLLHPANASQVPFDLEGAALDQGDSSGNLSTGSLITHPAVTRAIKAFKASAIKRAAQERQANMKTSVFSPRLAPCSAEYLGGISNRERQKASSVCLTPWDEKKQRDLHGPMHQPRFPDYIHFVHIPKAGGTSFTKVLRRLMCTRNGGTETELDCCTVGWCDWQKGITCQNIHGCTNHIPRMHKWLDKPLPSVVMIRNPVSRFISAWHYRCHNPNNDCYGVMSKSKNARPGKGPTKYSFEDYCNMPEYQNIMIKMFVLDKFPYGDYGELGSAELAEGVRRLDKFVFVGLNEMYDTSMVLLGDVFKTPLQPSDFDKERAANKPIAYKDFMRRLGSNTTLQGLVEKANKLDNALYEHGRRSFCEMLRNSAALLHPMIEPELENKNVCLDLWEESAL